MEKPLKINKRFTVQLAKLIIEKNQRNLVLNHLSKYNNNNELAFDTKTLKNEPLIYKEEPLKEVQCFEEIYTIRKEISPDLKIEKVIDEKVKSLLYDRLIEYNSISKEAFSDLDKNPIWLNKSKNISVRRVTIKGVSNVEPLHSAKNHLGEDIIDPNGNVIPVDYVSTGNNHHVAIYVDSEGNLQDSVVSFYEAVARVNQGLPIVNNEFNKHLGWEFMFSLKQNELFVFASEDFNPNELDLLGKDNAKIISPHLFRVQKISKVLAGNSYVRDFVFRHHLETTVETNKVLRNTAFIQIKSLEYLRSIVKVRINHIGQIIQVGEY